MRAAIIKKYGHKEPVMLAQAQKPQVRDEEILVEIHAASINPVDLKIRDGNLKLLLPYKFPLTLGNDFSGLVSEVGSRVKKFKVGDRVYGRPNIMKIGCFAEYIAIHQSEAAIMPTNLSFEEAASIPLVGLTSWQALVVLGNLKRNQKVFIQAGSGGVGSFAIQLAKEIGAFVATTTSSTNTEAVKKLGADIIVNYKNERFENILKDYDLVLDTLGGKELNKSFGILKKGGMVVSIAGVPDKNLAQQMGMGVWFQFLFSLISWKTRRIARHLETKYHFLFMTDNGDQLAQIARLIENGKIRPVIDRTFPFNEVTEALVYVESGRAKGKVILKIK